MKINRILSLAVIALSLVISCTPEEDDSWEQFIKDKQEQTDPQNPGEDPEQPQDPDKPEEPEEPEEPEDPEDDPQDGLMAVSIEAVIECSSTLPAAFQPCWKEGDAISVIDGNGKFYKMTAQSDGTTTVFKGRIEPATTRLGAVYPWTEDGKVHMNNNEVAVGSIAPDLITDPNSTVLPLYSVFSTKDSSGKFRFVFKPCTAAIMFEIRAEDSGKYKTLRITGRNGENKIGGQVALNLSTGNVAPVENLSKNVIAIAPDSGSIGAGTYMVPVYTLSKQTQRPFALGIDFSFETPSGKVGVFSVSRACPADWGKIVDLGVLAPEYPDKSYSVSGCVSYTDGSAAAGVSVSDGFQVTTTDSQGKYKISGVTTDCRYIYISMPANAKIGRNSNGCPDFFKLFDPSVSVYDFKLEKQAVETEFALFAMADPQAHHELRGSGSVMQAKVNTNRFRDETVPVLNATISDMKGMPCYGITLGDIVFSSGSRDSNPSMPVMRSHFSKVNMPVFQTMGNHDYTFFTAGRPLTVDSRTSSVNLKVQRAFEDCFGPINYSFNRGDVHIVGMRNIFWDKAGDEGYSGGFTDEQYAWLQADLANVPTDKMVILCMHIPLVSCKDDLNASKVAALLAKYRNATVFSGHTHYKRGYASVKSTSMYEHIHSAVCGTGWWSSVESDGCPNGFTVYKFKGPQISGEWFNGVNGPAASPSYQMRVYRGNITCGGEFAKFKWPHGENTILINIFNGDSRWGKVEVWENGSPSGTASRMSESHVRYESGDISVGSLVTVPAKSSQDWWGSALDINVLGRADDASFMSNCYHMWKYELKDANAQVEIRATDPYGTVYTCNEIIEDGTIYPSYVY